MERKEKAVLSIRLVLYINTNNTKFGSVVWKMIVLLLT